MPPQALGNPLPMMRVATTITSLLLLGCAVLAAREHFSMLLVEELLQIAAVVMSSSPACTRKRNFGSENQSVTFSRYLTNKLYAAANEITSA